MAKILRTYPRLQIFLRSLFFFICLKTRGICTTLNVILVTSFVKKNSRVTDMYFLLNCLIPFTIPALGIATKLPYKLHSG